MSQSVSKNDRIKRRASSSRPSARRARFLAITLFVGGACGIAAGLALTNSLPGLDRPAPNFAALSSNPAAATANNVADCAPDCFNEPVAPRYLDRMAVREDEELAQRALGRVEVEYATSPDMYRLPDEPADDGYRYGGAFPQPARTSDETAKVAVVTPDTRPVEVDAAIAAAASAQPLSAAANDDPSE